MNRKCSMKKQKRSHEQEALAQLARLIMSQRGERANPQALATYCRGLKQRMCAIQTDLCREITGADLFITIPRSEPATWESLSEDEQALYTAAVQDFNNHATADQSVHEQEVAEGTVH
jgi:hypothetical protein